MKDGTVDQLAGGGHGGKDNQNLKRGHYDRRHAKDYWKLLDKGVDQTNKELEMCLGEH